MRSLLRGSIFSEVRRVKRVFVFFFLFLLATPAKAQVHYDVGLQAGASKHFVTGGADGAAQPALGPFVGLSAHAAILPMLRAGLYTAFETSPESGITARRLYAGGLHARILPPFFRNACT